MADHVKPTKEELEENIKKSQEEIEKLVSPSAPPSDEETEEEKPQDEEEIEVKPEEKKEEVETPPADTQDDIDKKRLIEEKRQNLILNARQKKMNEAVEYADSLPEPTEEELQTEALLEGFTYDEMTQVEKSLFKTSVHSKRKLGKISEVAKEGRDIDDWNKKVDTYIDDPEVLVNHPKLEGKQGDFKIYSMQQTRRGVDFETLVSAFLYEEEGRKTVKKGSMFETPSGGGQDRPVKKDDKISPADAAILRKTNYKKFEQLLKAGKIRNL